MNEIHFPQLISVNPQFYSGTHSILDSLSPYHSHKGCEKKNDIKERLLQSFAIVDRIIDKPKIEYDIKIIEKQRQCFENNFRSKQEIYESQIKKFSLKIPHKRRVFFIGCIIDYFFRRHCQKIINAYRSLKASYLKQEQEYQNIISDLKKRLPTTEEMCPTKIFELECRLRQTLEKKFPYREKYVELYQSKVIPLLLKAKKSLTQTYFNLAACAGAEKGKAAQAYFRGLKYLIENDGLFSKNIASAQDVSLMPEFDLVLKKSDKRSNEEENIINSLFDLVTKQGAVGTFHVQNGTLNPFGIAFKPSSKIGDRGFVPINMPRMLYSEITERLTYADLNLLRKYEKLNHSKTRAFNNFQNYQEGKLWMKLPGDENPQLFSFLEIKKIYQSEKLPTDSLIGVTKESLFPLSQHILKDSSLFQALEFIPNRIPFYSCYLTPDLKNQAHQKAYELCEKYQWIYLDEAGVEHQVSFKKLHSQYLEKKQMTQVRPQTGEIPPSLCHSINLALNLNWRVVTAELKKENADGMITPLGNVNAKHYVHSMFRLYDLNEKARLAALTNLTEDSQLHAIYTSEFQLLDFHSANAGMAPVPNEEYEQFKHLKFYVPYSNTPINFKELLKDYLEGKIDTDTWIKFKKEINDKEINKNDTVLINLPLGKIPELEKALNVNWKLIIFDTDISLGETSLLNEQSYKNEKGHIIPLRSCLLETDWKDVPLSKKVINILMESEERDLRIKNWVNRSDAPIYQSISRDILPQLKDYVTPILERYSLSDFRRGNFNFTLKKLQEKFVEDLSKIKDQDRLKFWQLLENDLSYVSIRKNDNWDKIAHRHGQNEEELRKLNPNIDLNNLPLNAKIKIQVDLTSNDPHAIKKRKTFASQFFPRITLRQQQALFERQKNRSNYLINFHKLETSTLTGHELIFLLQEYINHPTTPLNSLRKNELLTNLEKIKTQCTDSPLSLSKFKQELIQECYPTFFNLSKAMYPLLANAYALNQAVYEGSRAGRYIGYFQHSIEQIMSLAIKNLKPDSPLLDLVKIFKEKIATIEKPAFFGNWN